MSKAFVYILGANHDPDNIVCKVPFKVDSKEIFFGPCKKNLRQSLKYLIGREIPEDIYLIGLNAAPFNGTEVRKIVWAGKIKEVMSFVQAYIRFVNNDKYDKLINSQLSPLHIEPLFHNNNLIGYRHRINGLHGD